MHLVFWQNILSPHQSAFLRALAAAGHEVTIITVESMTDDRRTLGWQVPDMGLCRVIVAPAVEQTRHLVNANPQETIHILAGARWTPLGNLATKLCLQGKRRIGVLTEAPDPRGVAGYGRRLKYVLERFSRGGRYDFIFAMGELGVAWFKNCGYSADRVFPFAYVAESTVHNFVPEQSVEPTLLFVGRFVGLKGLDILLPAFAGVTPCKGRLRLLGDGPLKSRLEQLVVKLELQQRVQWLPQCPASEVQKEMRNADVTILPSHKDGWGAVVNESLMVGTPVICSTACGAADLIRQPWLGSVFPAGAVEELAQCLKHWIDLGPRSAAEREKVRQWSACIQGEAVARYFTDVMTHVYEKGPRPEAPWRL